MKQKLSRAKQRISKAFTDVLTRFEPRSTFITFAIIFLPVSWLFFKRGALEQTLLVLYMGLMVLGGFVLLRKFLQKLVGAANTHDGKYGDLLKAYLFDAFLPLVMFRYFALLVGKLLPFDHRGLPELLCELYNMLGWLYPSYIRGYERPAELFDIQNVLNAIIMFSAALVLAFTIWSVGQSRRK